MSLIHFTQYNTLQIHPCCCKRQDFVLCRSWVVFHCVCMEKMCPSSLTNNLCAALRLLPYLDNCKQHCHEHWGASQISGFLDICPGMELLGHVIILFLVFLRNLYTILHSSCTDSHSHQQCERVPFFPHPCQHFSSEFFLTTTILSVVR